jgi:hypothetical protein
MLKKVLIVVGTLLSMTVAKSLDAAGFEVNFMSEKTDTLTSELHDIVTGATFQCMRPTSKSLTNSTDVMVCYAAHRKAFYREYSPKPDKAQKIKSMFLSQHDPTVLQTRY